MNWGGLNTVSRSNVNCQVPQVLYLCHVGIAQSYSASRPSWGEVAMLGLCGGFGSVDNPPAGREQWQKVIAHQFWLS